MSVIHFHASTASTPDLFIAGLTDFGPGRSKVFKNSADDYLTLHHKGSREADVTEGSGGSWETSIRSTPKARAEYYVATCGGRLGVKSGAGFYDDYPRPDHSAIAS
ncbi:MAG TPA: hypothetical protein VME67_04560 [Mycobacterium sp.]|nr:hypothetical protein [Mycobacterium sp.]HTX94168.1 hypothetical protein [Mycobacterium sp.]